MYKGGTLLMCVLVCYTYVLVTSAHPCASTCLCLFSLFLVIFCAYLQSFIRVTSLFIFLVRHSFALYLLFVIVTSVSFFSCATHYVCPFDKPTCIFISPAISRNYMQLSITVILHAFSSCFDSHVITCVSFTQFTCRSECRCDGVSPC